MNIFSFFVIYHAKIFIESKLCHFSFVIMKIQQDKSAFCSVTNLCCAKSSSFKQTFSTNNFKMIFSCGLNWKSA